MLANTRSWISARASGAGCVAVVIAFCFFLTGALAQAPAALTGIVSSSEEGAMEGVLVSAKKDGSAITTTVVTDSQGRYSFPAERVAPGKYTISIRAIGYKLDGPKSIEVPGRRDADLKLSKVKSLVPQLSNGEWLHSLPGCRPAEGLPDHVRGLPHAAARVDLAAMMRPRYPTVFLRMASYSPGSTPTHPQPLLPGPRGERPVVTGDAAKAAAEFLAGVSLGNAEAVEFPFKTLPRPKGRATKVIITEYDLPRKTALPHDVVIDRDGQVWYSDFGEQFVGVIDPKTGATKDIAIPVIKPEQPKGGLDLEFDPDGNVWLAMMYQAGIAKIDRKSHQVTVYPFPDEWSRPRRRHRWSRRLIRTSMARCGPNNQEDSTQLPARCRNRQVREYRPDDDARRQTHPRLRDADRSPEQSLSYWNSAAPASAGAMPRRWK